MGLNNRFTDFCNWYAVTEHTGLLISLLVHSERLQHINIFLECYFNKQISIFSINIHPQYHWDTLADLELLLSYRSQLCRSQFSYPEEKSLIISSFTEVRCPQADQHLTWSIKQFLTLEVKCCSVWDNGQTSSINRGFPINKCWRNPERIWVGTFHILQLQHTYYIWCFLKCLIRILSGKNWFLWRIPFLAVKECFLNLGEHYLLWNLQNKWKTQKKDYQLGKHGWQRGLHILKVLFFFFF